MPNRATDIPALEKEIAELEDGVRRAAELPSTSATQRAELLQRLEHLKQGAIQASALRSTLARTQGS